MAEELTEAQKKILEAIQRAQEEFNDDLLSAVDLTKQLNDNFKNAYKDLRNINGVLKTINDITDTAQKAALQSQKLELETMRNSAVSRAKGLMYFEKTLDVGNSLMKMGQKYGEELSSAFGTVNESLNYFIKASDLASLNDPTSKLLRIQGIYLLSATALKMGFTRFKELAEAAEEFRKETGLTVSQTKELDRYARSLNESYANLGVNIKAAYEAQSAIVKEFGSTLYITDSMTKNVALMSTTLGIAKEDTVKLQVLFNGMTRLAGETSEQLTLSAIKLAEMGQVAPKEIIKDMATASSDTLNMFSGMPRRMMIAAVEARRLGTTLDSMTKSSRGLLNFQDSINSEMELSALLGRNVNLQLAREYAWLGMQKESREAALDQLGTIDDFNRMTVFEKEAAAKAVGMETAEIIKQLGIREQQDAFERQIRKDLRSNDAELVAKAKERQTLQQKYNIQLKETERLKKKSTEDLAKEQEEYYRRNTLQSEFNKLSANFEKIWNNITKPFSLLAEKILPSINNILEIIGNNTALTWTAVIIAIGGATFALKKLSSLAKEFAVDKLKNIIDAVKSTTPAGPTTPPVGGAGTPSVPSSTTGPSSSRSLRDLSKGLTYMGRPGVREGAINLKIAAPALAGLRVGALGLKALERIDMVKVKKSLDDLADSISKFGTGKVTGGAFNMILAAPALLAIGLASLALWPLSKMSGAGMANGLSGIARGIERFGTFGVTRAIGNIALMGLATAGIIVAVGKSLTYASEGLKAMSDVDAEKAGKSAAVMASIVGGLYLLGQTGLAGLKGIGIGLLILGGAALGISAFAGALVLLGEGLNSVGPGLVLLGKGLSEILMPIVTLAAVSPLIGLAAISIGLLSGALVALASAQVLSSLLGFFSKDPFEKIIELSTKAKDIKTVSTAMSSLATSMKSFRSSDFSGLKDSTNIISDTVKAFINLFTKDPFERLLKAADKASQITQVANAVSSLEKSIRGFNDINFDGFKNATGLISDISTKITDKVKLELETTAKVVLEIKNLDEVKDTIEKITQAVSQLGELMAQQKPTIEVKTERMEQKLDELIGLMKDGAITAKVSTKELSSAMSTGGR